MMNKENLMKFIQKVYPVSDEKAFCLTDELEYFSFSKNEFLLKAKQINKKAYLLLQGYVRSYALDESGHVVTTGIYSAPSYVNDFFAFFNQQPVRETFQAVTECNGWSMSFEKVEEKFNNSLEFMNLCCILVLQSNEMLKERILSLVLDTAEKRYLKLLSKNPDVFQYVPLKVIASYLGVTDSSLSRIRKEVSKK